MPDISMCTNDSCPLAESCYRHEAIPGMRQSWSSFKPLHNLAGTFCAHFWPVEGREVRVRRPESSGAGVDAGKS